MTEIEEFQALINKLGMPLYVDTSDNEFDYIRVYDNSLLFFKDTGKFAFLLTSYGDRVNRSLSE